MGRHKYPEEIGEMMGTYEKNPNRKPKPSPKSKKSLGKPQEGLTDSEKEIWKEISKNVPPNVLTSGDRILVEMVAKLVAKMRDPNETMKISELTLLSGLISKLGMSPVDRQKIAAPPEESKDDDDPYAEFSS